VSNEVMLFTALGFRKTWTFFLKRYMDVLERPQGSEWHYFSAYYQLSMFDKSILNCLF